MWHILTSFTKGLITIDRDDSYVQLKDLVLKKRFRPEPDRIANNLANIKAMDALREYKNLDKEAYAIYKLLSQEINEDTFKLFDSIVPTGNIEDNLSIIIKRAKINNFNYEHFKKTIDDLGENFKEKDKIPEFLSKINRKIKTKPVYAVDKEQNKIDREKARQTQKRLEELEILETKLIRRSNILEGKKPNPKLGVKAVNEYIQVNKEKKQEIEEKLADLETEKNILLDRIQNEDSSDLGEDSASEEETEKPKDLKISKINVNYIPIKCSRDKSSHVSKQKRNKSVKNLWTIKELEDKLKRYKGEVKKIDISSRPTTKNVIKPIPSRVERTGLFKNKR